MLHITLLKYVNIYTKKELPIDEVINPFQHNALYKAINIGNLAFAEWLINHGSNPNGNILANGTPMYFL